MDELKGMLTTIMSRLDAIEVKVGGGGGGAAAGGGDGEEAPEDMPAVIAYDAYVNDAVKPLAKTCDDLGGLKNTGALLLQAWDGVRDVIILAAKSKSPPGELATALNPHLAKTQEAMKSIRELRFDRDWDRHYKALVEMLTCLSWVMYKPPKQLPAGIVKETLGSAEFWSNRIRKDYKGKDDTQIAFCDGIKKTINGLTEYIQQNHKTGLTFNPRGKPLSEAAAAAPAPAPAAAPVAAAKPKKPAAAAGIGSLMGELSTRKNSDGSSAATGLKKVTKDMQTWRKEFKKEDGPAPVKAAPAAKKVTKKKTEVKRGPPVFEYQDRGFKWCIENHTKETVKEIAPDGIVVVTVSDPKQQVYLYNCDGVTVKVVGKFKSLAIDKSTSCAVVYETLISGAEVVNSKKIQLQVTGICPVFTIDKTYNLQVYLSKETLDVSTFATSLSSEMNVNFPDGEDMKEVPIPEQFVHSIKKGSLTSEVSDLYH